jgi:predicted transposase YbfD/YdcC
MKQTAHREESQMQGIASRADSASSCDAPTPQPSSLVVSPNDLLSIFASVPDPRRRQGTRFALSAILALAVAAILSNHLSVLAIAEWGTGQCRGLLQTLGFADGVTPHQSTLQRLFRKLDLDALSSALTTHFAMPKVDTSEAQAIEPLPRGSQGASVDGKSQRGRLVFDSSGCPVHALSAYLHDCGVVLAQEPIDPHPQSGESVEGDGGQSISKAEAELSVAPDLIKRVDWRGRVFTGDALFCQRSICKQVVHLGGDYLLIVKENQPTLYEDIRLLFDPPAGIAVPLTDQRVARTIDHGHGRQHDTRTLVASTDLVGYTNWPHLAQVFRHHRIWQEKGVTKSEVRYGITSLPASIADADRLLQLKRGHWQIENCDHYVKDVTLGEDRSLIHLGNGPSAMATFRDLALTLLHLAGFRAIASRLRHNSRHPEDAVALIFGHNPQNA